MQPIDQYHKRIKELVEECLNEFPICRNNDKWLIFKVWEKQGVNFAPSVEQINTIAEPESIRRNRQTIQNTEGRLLPTELDIAIKRGIDAEILRKYYYKELR